MDERIASILKKQGYAIVGKHSGVKLCHWLRQSLLHNRVCYKQRFYGIESHRCLQMTPAINHCTQSCLFCWRYQGFTQLKIDDPDDPDFILEESIKAQRRLITGYKGDPRVDKKKWEEATDPKHLACSLTGEPTLYPMLGELFESAHKKGMTTFLVTNGTNPDVLENLDPLPTQLYVSITAPNEDVYRKLNRPLISKGWERIQRTLEILPSLDTRIVIRHTLVKGWNMREEFIKEYARIIDRVQPLFVEPKAYMFVGYSRKRLSIENMPSFDEIVEFGKKLSEETGYLYLNESRDSRVVLLGRERGRERIG